MTWVLHVFLALGALWLLDNYKTFLGPEVAEPPQPLAGVTRSPGSTGIRIYEFQQLLDARMPLSGLAKSGYYTVVEVYLDSCSICRKLETGFKPLLAKRKDTYIRRVHFPEDGIKFSFSGTSQEEVQRQADEANAMMKSYRVCGTPHVVVFDPSGQVMATDACGERNNGTRFLQNWINTETGLLSAALGTATSIF